MQEKRAQEDHQHVTQMHQLVMEMISKQREELEELREMLTALQGKPYEKKAVESTVDLRELHPRGGARFEKHDIYMRMDGHIHRHHLTEKLREDYKPVKNKEK